MREVDRKAPRLDMVPSRQCRQDSKFLEIVIVATVRLETVKINKV